MDFRLSPEEEAFRQEVEHFFRHEVEYPPGWKPFHQFAMEKEDWEFIRRVARKLGEKGWLSLAWPKEYGGKENPILDALLAEAVAYHGVIFARDVFGVGMLAPTLMHFGTEEQKRRHLPPIAKGEIFWCEGYSEPGAGSDLAGVQLRAEEKDDHFLINGQKMWTTNAHNADWIFFVARTDPTATPKHRGLSFLLADMRTPGIEVRPVIGITGSHETNEVFFDNVRVPKENLVGEKNRGFYVAMALLEFERSVAQFSGNAKRVLERLIEYVRETGVLKNRPYLRHQLAQMAAELEIVRLLEFRNMWMRQKRLPYSMEPSIAKVFASEMGRRLYEVGMQILGLYGQLTHESKWAQLEGELAYLYFDSVKDTIVAGTSEIQRNIIAQRGLEMPKSY